MTAIPTDIQKAAAAVYARLGRGPDADEQAIAKALLAERDRCSAVVRRFPPMIADAETLRASHQVDFANAILTPSTGA